MTDQPHPARPPPLFVLALAVAAVGLQGRARAQEGDDDDKLPAPVVGHATRPPDSEPPAPEAKPAEQAKPEQPSVDGASDATTAPPHKSPPAKKHHKETKRERRERLRREKLAKRRKKARPAEPEPAEPAAPEAPPTAGAREPGEGEARRPAAGDMDFDLMPQKAQGGEEAAAVESKIKTRRTMLQLHQGFGIATAVLMAGTVVTGQLNYSDRFGGGGSTGAYEGWHDTLEAATVVSFTTAGLLAVLAPSPFEHKSDGVDTVTIHKWTMLVATIGMGAEVPLGIWTVTREGYTNQGTLALTHLIVGYVTAAALTVGASALFF